MRDVCKKIFVGIATSTTKYFVDDGVPLLRNQNIKNGYIETDNLLHISKEFAKINQSKKLQSGDVVCMRTGYPGQSAVVSVEMDGWQTFTTLIMRPNSEIIDSQYLSLFLNSIGRKQITSVQAGAAQQNLNAGWLSNLMITIPSFNEQQKITKIISNLENLINSYDKIITTIKNSKTGLMQYLFTKGIDHKKFKKVTWLFGKEIEIPEEWIIKKFKDIVPKNRKITYGIVQPGEYDENGILLVRGQDYISGWDNKEENYFKVDPKLHQNYIRAKIIPKDILLCIVGAGVGAVNQVPEWIKEANITQTTARIACDESTLLSEYLLYFLSSSFGKIQSIKFTKGSAQPGLNLADVEKFQLITPVLLEQKKIILILSNIDLYMNTLETKKNYFENLKKGLMQNLLTGKIRVKI